MTNKLTPGEALQKILDALGVDDLNLNSRGLFEDYIRQAASAESAKELAEKDGAWICAGHGANFTQDCAECWWVKRCNEKDAEIERLKRVIGSFRYALLKYREEEWLGGEDGIAAEALESETIAFTKKED
jgi:hypothetical protein